MCTYTVHIQYTHYICIYVYVYSMYCVHMCVYMTYSIYRYGTYTVYTLYMYVHLYETELVYKVFYYHQSFSVNKEASPSETICTE